MKERIVKYASTLALLLGVVILSAAIAAGDDAKTTSKDSPTKGPDFSKYTFVKDMPASTELPPVEVVKADDKKLSITVKWTVNKQPNPRMPPRLVEMHQDYEFQFLPESLVRTQNLPPKTDEKGKKVAYTQKEKDALKLPEFDASGKKVPGYAAKISDLTPGTLVSVTLVRDKSIPAAKATDDDLRVKWVIIKPANTSTTTPPNKN